MIKLFYQQIEVFQNMLNQTLIEQLLILSQYEPVVIVATHDAVDANGNPKYQGMDVSFLVATLTAALQELDAKFEAYKASHP